MLSVGAVEIFEGPDRLHEHIGIDADHRRARRRITSFIIATETGFRDFDRMPLSAVIEPVAALMR